MNDHVPIPSPPDYYAFAAYKKGRHNGDVSYAFEYMNAIIQTTPGAKLLEIGCGMNTALDHIDQSVSYVGIDSEAFCISELSKHYPSQHFVAGYAENLPFGDRSFDMVFSCQALEMFHDPRTALTEIMRVAKPGGSIIIIAPNFENPFSRVNAIRHYGLVRRLWFTVRRVADTVLRLFGIISFRTIPENVVQAMQNSTETYRYLPDDDAKYVTSAYEVAAFFHRNGYQLVYHTTRRPRTGLKELILHALTILPLFTYYGGGMFFIFRKS